MSIKSSAQLPLFPVDGTTLLAALFCSCVLSWRSAKGVEPHESSSEFNALSPRACIRRRSQSRYGRTLGIADRGGGSRAGGPGHVSEHAMPVRHPIFALCQKRCNSAFRPTAKLCRPAVIGSTRSTSRSHGPGDGSPDIREDNSDCHLLIYPATTRPTAMPAKKAAN